MTVRIDVRRLARDVEVEVARDRVPVGDAAAGLDRGDVDARDVDVDRDDLVRGRERGVGGALVTGLPVPDVVVLLVLAAILAQHRRIGLERLERVDHDRQRLVVDVRRR